MKAIYQFKGVLVVLILTMVFSLDTYAQGKKTTKGPPTWAPAHGYRANTRQVYFPEQNLYYDVEKSVYISLSGGNWQVSASLPAVFAGVDLSIAMQVELDLNTDTPQKYNAEHKEKYKGKDKGAKDKQKDKSNKGKKKN